VARTAACSSGARRAACCAQGAANSVHSTVVSLAKVAGQNARQAGYGIRLGPRPAAVREPRPGCSEGALLPDSLSSTLVPERANTRLRVEATCKHASRRHGTVPEHLRSHRCKRPESQYNGVQATGASADKPTTECSPAHPAHCPTLRRAQKLRTEPQALTGTRRTFHERADDQKTTRSAPDRIVGQLGARVGNTPHRFAKPSQAHRAPRQPLSAPIRPTHERASPTQQRARRQSPCTHANGSPGCAPAPEPSDAAPQAHPDARRTFHEPRGPPETDAERARGSVSIVSSMHRTITNEALYC
jgi:hypothetical protein